MDATNTTRTEEQTTMTNTDISINRDLMLARTIATLAEQRCPSCHLVGWMVRGTLPGFNHCEACRRDDKIAGYVTR